MKCAEYEVTRVIGRAVAVVLVPVVWIALAWGALIGLCMVLAPFYAAEELHITSAFGASIYITAGCTCIAFFLQYVNLRDEWERETTEE